MESVKICPTCGQDNMVSAMFCSECSVSLAGTRVIPKAALAAATEYASGYTADPEASARCPDCGAPNRPGTVICEICATRLAAGSPAEAGTSAAGLEWPWGHARLLDYLAIGLDPSFSQLAAKLAAFPNVSRRHAEIRRRGVGFVVRDLNSTNGTFLDNQAVPPQQDVDLHDGATLRFARHLTASVRLSR